MLLVKLYSRFRGRFPKRKAARGMALFELSIAVALAGIMTVSGLVYYKRQIEDDSARALAKQYEIMNDAVGVYMSNHWIDLLSLGQACNGSGWNTMSSQARPSGCSKTFGSVTVLHALQPSMSELIALGYLSQGSSGPILTFDPAVTVYTFGGTASHTFGIWIQIYCTKIANSTSLTQCPILSDRTLRSVVFNTRPYLNIQNNLYSILANTLSALPVDAGMSIPFFNDSSLSLIGRSQTLGSEPMSGRVVIPNPVKVNANSSTGIFGILGVRNVYTSSLYTLRDGSMLPTNSWEFNNKDLTNVNKVAAQQVHATSSLLIPDNTPGAQCNPSSESVAISQDRNAILFCDRDSSRWSFPQGRGIRVDSSTTFFAMVPPGYQLGSPIRLQGSDPEQPIGWHYPSSSDWAMPLVVAFNWGGVTRNFSFSTCQFFDATPSDNFIGNMRFQNSLSCASSFSFFGGVRQAVSTQQESITYQPPIHFEVFVGPDKIWSVAFYNGSVRQYTRIDVRLFRIAK